MTEPTPMTNEEVDHFREVLHTKRDVGVTTDDNGIDRVLRVIATIDVERNRADEAVRKLTETRGELAGALETIQWANMTQVTNMAKVAEVNAEVARLRDELDSCQLRYIEATNPGIDMEDVKRVRALADQPEEPSE